MNTIAALLGMMLSAVAAPSAMAGPIAPLDNVQKATLERYGSDLGEMRPVFEQYHSALQTCFSESASGTLRSCIDEASSKQRCTDTTTACAYVTRQVWEMLIEHYAALLSADRRVGVEANQAQSNWNAYRSAQCELRGAIDRINEQPYLSLFAESCLGSMAMERALELREEVSSLK